jgi:3-oxosteroid 1-dehydrogenase
MRILAQRGVLIASGGFSHSPSMRQKYSADQPNDGKWSLSNPGDTGEVLLSLIDHGAAIDQMDEAWWNPCALGPNGTMITIAIERIRPYSIMVDGSGKRYFNESTDYVRTGQAMYRREKETGGGVPSWLILDARHRSRYNLGLMPPGRTSREWIEGGYLKRSDTLAGLAEQMRIDAATLEETVRRFNRFAESGVDDDFHRGVGAHERYYGDPTHKPNPCIGPLAKPPFYAIEVYPGDVGTCGGVICDEHARVLGVDGQVILGVYAAGNVTASVVGRTYPGAGASIAASAVFSYIAANNAAREATPGSSASQSTISFPKSDQQMR